MKGSLLRLGNNLGTLILALLLAFVIWIAANLQVDAFANREVTSIPVALSGKPDDAVLSDPIAERVSVTVRARESVLERLQAGDFTAMVDLSGVPVGASASIPISVTCSNNAVRIEEVTPPRQSVNLVAVRTVTMPVDLDVKGEPATGFLLNGIGVSPQAVSITGPEPQIAEVVSATVAVDLNGLKEDTVRRLGVALFAQGGQALTDLLLEPASVDVSMSVRRRLGYKPDVEVVPDLRGEPAPGYRLGSVSVEPQTVTLTGLESFLDELPGFVQTLPISVTGATQNLTERSLLTLPSSVVAVGVDYVTVMVEVLAIQSSRAMTSTVEIQGLSLGWTAAPSPEVVAVILEGPDALLTALQPGDLRIRLNVFGLGLGVHRLQPDVLAPEGVSLVTVIPETIEVVISVRPTPAPTLTVTPTVTVSP